jgi:hypothetical protein
MSWRALELDDLLTGVSGPLENALRTAARKGGQSEPVEETRLAVTEFVRGQVGAGGSTLGPLGQVPTATVLHAVSVWRMRTASRLQLKAPDDWRSEYDAAIAYLSKCAEGKIIFVSPDDPSTEQVAGGGAEVVGGRTRKNTRETMAGL